SACGAACQCSPRKVPRARLKETLHWAQAVANPCSANSRAQNTREKCPLGSSRFSMRIRNAPGRDRGSKIIFRISDHLHLRNRHHETAAPFADEGHLFHHFVAEVPG